MTRSELGECLVRRCHPTPVLRREHANSHWLKCRFRGCALGRGNILAGCLLVNYFSVISAFKSLRVWWKLFAGLFFVCAAVDRAINGGSTPGTWPTVLYALTGSRFIFDGFRCSRKSLNFRPR